VSLLTELDAFYLDHRRCGELDGGVDDATVWLACECGAGMTRRADEGDRAGPAGAAGWRQQPQCPRGVP
jgi:hypothetical protein